MLLGFMFRQTSVFPCPQKPRRGENGGGRTYADMATAPRCEKDSIVLKAYHYVLDSGITTLYLHKNCRLP